MSGGMRREDADSVYQTIKTIGKGSYGVVDLVQVRSNQKLCVMKKVVLERDKASSAMKEVQILKAIKHPNIVEFVDAFLTPDQSQLCIVMAYCENGDLTQYIKAARRQGKSIPEAQIMEWFVQICMALCYLHDNHWLHRDIKPHNVFLTGGGRIVKLGDFGVTKLLENTAAFAKTTIGTPYYISPEICNEQPYSYASDVWALGVMMYELCALTVPFNAKDFPSLRRVILETKPASLSRKYDVELRRLIGDMLYKDPSKRPTVRAMMSRPYVQYHLRQLIAQHSRPKVLGPSSESAPPTVPTTTRTQPPITATTVDTTSTSNIQPTPDAPRDDRTGVDRDSASRALEQAQQQLASTVAELNAAKMKLMQEEIAKPLKLSTAGSSGKGTPDPTPAVVDRYARRSTTGAPKPTGSQSDETPKTTPTPTPTVTTTSTTAPSTERVVEQLEIRAAQLEEVVLKQSVKLHELATRNDVDKDVEALVDSASREAAELEGMVQPRVPPSVKTTPTSTSKRPSVRDVVAVSSGGRQSQSTAPKTTTTATTTATVIAEDEAEESFDRTIRRDSVELGVKGPLGDVGKQLVSAITTSPPTTPTAVPQPISHNPVPNIIVPTLPVWQQEGERDALPRMPTSGRLSARNIIPSPPASVPLGQVGFGRRPGSRRSNGLFGVSNSEDSSPFGIGVVGNVVTSAREDLKRSERSEPVIINRTGRQSVPYYFDPYPTSGRSSYPDPTGSGRDTGSVSGRFLQAQGSGLGSGRRTTTQSSQYYDPTRDPFEVMSTGISTGLHHVTPRRSSDVMSTVSAPPTSTPTPRSSAYKRKPSVGLGGLTPITRTPAGAQLQPQPQPSPDLNDSYFPAIRE